MPPLNRDDKRAVDNGANHHRHHGGWATNRQGGVRSRRGSNGGMT
jgi:hypothetical protein